MDTLTVDQYAKYLTAIGTANTPKFDEAYAEFLSALGYSEEQVATVLATRAQLENMRLNK